MLTRRTFLAVMLAASAGPAIVRCASLMPVRPLAPALSLVEVDVDVEGLWFGEPAGNEMITKFQQQIARSLRIPAANLFPVPISNSILVSEQIYACVDIRDLKATKQFHDNLAAL